MSAKCQKRISDPLPRGCASDIAFLANCHRAAPKSDETIKSQELSYERFNKSTFYSGRLCWLGYSARLGARATGAAVDQRAFCGRRGHVEHTQRMARYVAETGALDQTTIEAAKAHFIDAIGCGISAYHEVAVRACRQVALAVPGGVSTVIGTKRRTTPDLATFANGAAIRYFDFNDLYFGREPGHPSDNITACLAIAEAEGRNGRDFLLAMVLAYEINCRLLDAAELTKKGWDHPINSLPASALAAGKLMDLPAEKLEQAVNIALNGHIAMEFETRAVGVVRLEEPC